MVITRSKTRNKAVVSIVRKLMDDVENAHAPTDKVKIISEIFVIFNERIEFVKRHKKFSETVRAKIKELRNDPYFVRIDERSGEDKRTVVLLLDLMREIEINMEWEG
jgi:hypothetical protein